jgi:hypothetical protein
VALSGGFDEVSLGVLNEWVESRETQKIIAITDLLRQVDGGFVFSHESFIVALLRQADLIGAQTLRKVSESLEAIALGNLAGSGTPGEPMPFKVEVREKARAAATRYPAASIQATFYARLQRQAEDWLEADQLDWEEENG